MKPTHDLQKSTGIANQQKIPVVESRFSASCANSSFLGFGKSLLGIFFDIYLAL